MSWWNTSYLFRNKLTLTNSHEEVPEDHLITVSIDMEALYDNGKTREDYQDVQVVHATDAATPVYTVLAREVDDDYVRFFLPFELDKSDSTDDIFLYYGNWNLNNHEEPPEYEENLWTVSRLSTERYISYTRPGQHWSDGISETKDAVATATFYGSRVRVRGSKGIDQGIALVSIDDGDWEEADFFATTTSTSTVFEKTDLSAGKHKIQVKVSGRSEPGSTGIEISIVSIDYLTPITTVIASEEIYNVNWSSVISGAN